LTANNVKVVPIERLTDEQLEFYLAWARQGHALPPVTDAP
jgi:hypothetical protein